VSLLYGLLYRIGFTPWDTDKPPAELQAIAEGAGALPPGRMLDLGCGTGRDAVYLAGHGWQVTAVDNVERALQQARARAAARNVTVEWVNGDVSRLLQLGLQPGYTLVFDRGCYHGLRQRERQAYAAAVTALASQGATLLIWARHHNRRLLEPAGADGAEITTRFAEWDVSCPNQLQPRDPGSGLTRGWYRLTRR
jgi:SAM-dependent methyltransferase